MEQKLSFNKDNLDCYNKAYRGEFCSEFVHKFNQDIFTIPYKYGKFFKHAYLHSEDDHHRVDIVKGKYFIPDIKTNHLIYKDYKGKPYAIDIISSLLVPATYNFIHEKKIFPKFVKIFFKNIEDILYFTKLLDIKEVLQFIEGLFKLHKATDVQKISINEFISKSGGEQYIKDMIASYMYKISKFLAKPSHEQENYLRLEVKVAELLKNIEYDMNVNNKKKDLVQYFISCKNSGLNNELDYFSLNCIKEIISSIEQTISDNYSSEYYNRAEINDIIYLIEGNPIYSKFLSVYSNVEKHYYKFQYIELINNKFYSEFLSLTNGFDDKTRKLLIINLIILAQNN
jgi:hypothetical protein